MTKPTTDLDIRIAVTAAALAAGIPRPAVRHEVPLDTSSGDGRADIVFALDRCLVGIEIKSGKDRLDRLDSQRRRYGVRFDRLVLVLDARHEPADWDSANALDFGVVRIAERRAGGSIVLRRQNRLWGPSAPWEPPEPGERFRASRTLCPHAMLSMLWSTEALTLAGELVTAGVIPHTGGPQRYRVIPHVAEHAAIAQIRPRIAAALRGRSLNRWEEGIWSRFDHRRQEDCDGIA